MDEIEIVQHPQMDDVSIFLDTVDYRTPHLHRELELIWIMDGSLQITQQQKQCIAAPGSMILFHPNQLHEFHKVEKSCTFLCLQVAPNFYAHSFPAIESIVFDDPMVEGNFSPAEYLALQELLTAAAFSYLEKPPYYGLYCAAQLNRIFYELVKKIPHRILTQEQRLDLQKRNHRMERLLAFVDENYQQKIRLSDFAGLEKRSVNYMSLFVKEMLGQTFQEYVNTVRFHCACKLIDSGKGRLLDVCMEAGFSDYRYFSRTFQKELGLTPEEYRTRRPHIEINTTKVHHSVHSLERFYTREKSIELLRQYLL